MTEWKPDSGLINPDIVPVALENRTWSVVNMAALWIWMVVCAYAWFVGFAVAAGVNWGLMRGKP